MTKVVHLYASQRVSRRAKDGSDGTSVTIISTSVTYQISASGTETPTGNWSDKVVATTDTKPYLWTRTIVVYSDTNSTTSYSVSYKGKDGAPGKDAYRVEASPSTLVFDTNENGVVDGSALSGKYATVTVYKGSQKISTDNLSLPSNYATKKYTNVDGKISNNNGEARITITKIEQETISGDEKVSKSSGQISFPIDVLGERSTLMWVTVNVQVNVAKFTGSVVANNKKFETKFTEISNRFKNTPTNKDLTDAESRITQTAREISLSVSEKTIGRRNLLIGSAARRQGEGWTFMSGDYYNGLPCDSIEINSGHEGVNAIHCRTKQTGTNSYYMCGFRWIGSSSSQGNIKLEKGKSYTLSFWAKAYNSGYVNFVSELIWEGSATDNSRPAGYAGPKGFSTTQQATKNNTWTLFKVNIEVPSDSSYEYVEVNVFARATNYTLQDAFICKPMFEEGDYNGWTLSTEDYDYVGGNMLDNTRTLDKSGTLCDVNGALTPAGFGESTSIYKSFAYELKGSVDSFSQLPSSGNVYGDTYCVRNTEICYRYNGSEFESVGNDYYYNVLEWGKLESGAFVPFGLEANKDYVFSFMAKGTGKLTAYFYNPETNVFIESSLGETATRVDGAANFQLTRDWKKYWVHWRPSDSSHRYILLRLNRTIQSSAGDAPITNCYIAQPKLEAGAVVTEYTERKSDLVDKASLKAAGIEITSDQVKLYGDKVQVLTRKDGDTEYEEAGMFSKGKLNANLIDAGEVVANGINAKEVTATKLHVTGDSTFGIWTVDGNQITTKGSFEFNGMTFIGQSIQYTAGFVRAGSINTKYMRLGSETAEFGEFRNNAYNGIWFGSASNTVYNGNSNYWKLPTDYKYKEVESATVSGTPTAYIHNTDSGENPAFAINRPNGGVALRTNGALKGSHAFNTRRTNSTLINMQNGEGLIVCTSNYATTVNLPKNPAIGEMVTIIQSGNGKLSIYGSNNIKTISKDDNESDGRISATKGQINLFFYDGTHWVCSFINNYLNKISK